MLCFFSGLENRPQEILWLPIAGLPTPLYTWLLCLAFVLGKVLGTESSPVKFSSPTSSRCSALACASPETNPQPVLWQRMGSVQPSETFSLCLTKLSSA